MDEPPPGDAFCSRYNILLMFGEGAISSSESPAPSACGVLEPGVPETVLPFRTLWIGEGSFPVRYSGFCPPEIEVVRGSLLEAALERVHHLAVRRRRRRGLVHRGLIPIRSRLSIRSSVPHRGPSFVRSSGPIRGLRNRGLAPSGSNRPGVVPPHLGRTDPVRGSSGTGMLRAASLLTSPSNCWRILDQGDFTNYLVEGSGW